MTEKLQWLVDHWQGIGFILTSILALFGVKKWRVADRAVAVLTGANEGFEGGFIRKKVARITENEGLNVRGLIENHAARTDPRYEKKPSVKESLKALAPDFVREAAGALIGRLFKRRERER